MPDVNITPSEDGPYIVSGPVTLTDVDGRVIEHPDPMAMCRCGHSSNKPFCDGTHATIDFDGPRANGASRHDQRSVRPPRLRRCRAARHRSMDRVLQP